MRGASGPTGGGKASAADARRGARQKGGAQQDPTEMAHDGSSHRHVRSLAQRATADDTWHLPPRACQPGAGLLRRQQRRHVIAFGNAHRLHQHRGAGACARRLFRDVAAEGACARPAVVKAQDVPRDIVEAAACAQVPFGVGDQGFDDIAARRSGRLSAEQAPVDVSQQIRILIGGAAEPDAVDLAPSASRPHRAT